MIYDCFPFFNEVDLLRFRIEMLDSFVDRFVIVEANKTQSGMYKPFYFDEVKDSFAKWMDKIIHIKVTDAPALQYKGDWSIEFFQRNCILRGLIHCNPEDLILISDVDEMPNPDIFATLDDYTPRLINVDFSSFLDRMKQKFLLLGIKPSLFFKKNTAVSLLEIMPLVLQQKLSYYYMNYRACGNFAKWYGTILVKYKNLQMPQKLRNQRNMMPYIAGNVGWHFSYLGGIEQIEKKLESIVEGGILSIPKEFSSQNDYINFCLNRGEDIFNRKEIKYEKILPSSMGLKNSGELIEKYPHFFIL